jgi:mannose-6-phosphate isomerase-like protein (cupin superfamily)
LTVDDSVIAVETGSVVYVPPGGKQSLENSGPTAIEFLCLVDPAWRPEDEEVLE